MIPFWSTNSILHLVRVYRHDSILVYKQYTTLGPSLQAQFHFGLQTVYYPWSESTGMIPFWSTNSILQLVRVYRHDSIFGLHNRLYTEWRLPLSGVHSIMMEKLSQPGEGGGCTPTPFHFIYHNHLQKFL
jgi:hypothetical protein